MLDVQHIEYKGLGPFSFTIEAGVCVGLTGPSGAGKSLLLRALCDLDDSRGHVALNGRNMREAPAPEWRRTIGFLPAESQWWDDRVQPHFTGEPGRQYLEPLGFEPDVMNWSISRLSSGERQRLALLRLLVNLPDALLLDEPTAHLDAGMVERAEQLILQYQRERMIPILWVSHNREQLERIASRILRLDDRRLIREVVSWT
ncbi:MAG: ATP-binding cassette domain-containing protein [Spartobacteria bacterium]|nr:ATP-binding cassette domain-containing protein [Spartobacteria bacterium]